MDIYNLALRPNCLLTKYPLVFLNGPRSMFFYEKLGGSLQDYLSAHGYKLFCPALPFRGSVARQAALSEWLLQNEIKNCHFFLGKKTKDELFNSPTNVENYTFTFIDEFTADEKRSPGTKYRLHQSFLKLFGSEAESFAAVLPVKNLAIFDRFLDRCIELAENE